MSENYRKSIASLNKFPQFTTMNVIDGQAGLIIYTSLIFYSLTRIFMNVNEIHICVLNWLEVLATSRSAPNIII